MSIAIKGFKSSPFFEQIAAGVTAEAAKKVNAVFQFDVKNASGTVQSWTLDLKTTKPPFVTADKAPKPDITITVSDDDFVQLAEGKLNGQKAFMSGKLKVKGNMMLATKLDAVLKQARSAQPVAKSAPVAAAPSVGAVASVQVAGFNSSSVFNDIATSFAAASSAEKKEVIKKGNAVFQFDIKNSQGKVQSWTLDLKGADGGKIYTGPASGKKADAILSLADSDFLDLAGGKMNGQKAFMSGKLKVKGQIMLAAKLDSLLKELSSKKAKL